MNLEKIKNILIVRLSSLGDILLTTPVIRSLKSKYPNLQIDFLVREQYKDTVKYNPHINKVFTLDSSNDIESVKSKLKNRNYELIIDLQNNIRSRKLTKNLSPEIVRFKKPNFDKFLLVNFKINRFQEIIQIPVRYSAAIPNFVLDDKGLELFGDKSVNAKFDIKKRTIAFCPGSKHKTKMWPENYFIELGKKFIENNYNIILLGGMDDKEACSKINHFLPQAKNLSNDNLLLETAEIMQNCTAVICNDSGLMHTAIAVNVPVISIFGSTVKEFGFAPYKGKSLVLENNNLTCRPCSHIGLNECPQKHFKCMLDITPDFVYNKSVEFIKSLNIISE